MLFWYSLTFPQLFWLGDYYYMCFVEMQAFFFTKQCEPKAKHSFNLRWSRVGGADKWKRELGNRRLWQIIAEKGLLRARGRTSTPRTSKANRYNINKPKRDGSLGGSNFHIILTKLPGQSAQWAYILFFIKSPFQCIASLQVILEDTAISSWLMQ